jgi:hypothetical protein
MSCYCGRKDCETCNPSLLNRDLKGLRYETPKKEISIKALEEFVGSLDESKDEIIEPLTGYRDIDDFLRETLATAPQLPFCGGRYRHSDACRVGYLLLQALFGSDDLCKEGSGRK